MMWQELGGGTLNPGDSFLQWGWSSRSLSVSETYIDSHWALGDGWSSHRVASRFQETELNHMTLGALSKSGVKPKFFQPVPALTVP